MNQIRENDDLTITVETVEDDGWVTAIGDYPDVADALDAYSGGGIRWHTPTAGEIEIGLFDADILRVEVPWEG